MSYKIKKILINEMWEPIGLDIETPIFSWIFKSDVPMMQKKAQILVGTQPEGNDSWDSGVMVTDQSINIPYQGEMLQPETRYFVTLRTWDENGEMAEKQTWFETGLMNHNLDAWEGAKWIGAPEYYVASDTISTFIIESTLRIEEGYRAGIVFGANDYRLLDREKNESMLQGENFIRYEIDISMMPAKINIFRIGYAAEDSTDEPLATFPVVSVENGVPVITEENRREKHVLTVEVRGNIAYTYVDGVKVDEVEKERYGMKIKTGRQLNPLADMDITTFPRLCSIGYYAGKNTKVYFDGLHVRNLRKPNAEIISLDTEEGKILIGEAQEVCDPSKHSIPMLRSEFNVEKKLLRARLYATARGIYECSINGKRVGDEYFAPGASQYDKHLMYQTYDVTAYLQEGENAIGCTLASGWWCDSATYMVDNYNFWGDKMSFLAKLVLVYEDGTRKVVVTNTENWQYYGEGPYRFAGFFNGEHFDARKAEVYANYSKAGFMEEGMKTPVVITPVSIPASVPMPMPWPAVNETEPELMGSYLAPVHVAEVLTAKSMSEPAPGIYIYDLGQEIAGVPIIKLRGKRGQKVYIRYGEILYPHLEEYGELAGRMLQANLREASNTDIYICSGIGTERYKPRFTFHGFRYIEISGIDMPPALGDVRGVMLSSVNEITGKFNCSNQLVNKLVSNVSYSQKCNFISIPTDCPQRNERMGWVGDTHVFCRTATYQSNVKNFYLRNLQAMSDLQTEDGRLPNIAPVGGGFGGITYESAMVLMVWELYQQYGDVSVIRDFYTCMKKWMISMKHAGFPGAPQEFGLGDWLSVDDTDIHLIWNAFHYRNAWLMMKFAQILGYDADRSEYEQIALETKKYWNDTFIDPASGMTRYLDGRINDTQGSYVIALNCGVIYDESVQAAHENLARKTRECGCTVRTGFFGTGPLNPMLSEGGHKELAQKLINQTNYPSWLYPVTQGATTVWEHWDSYTLDKGFNGQNSMNSFNHYSLGSVLSWLYENVLGIKRDENAPGYKHFSLRPEIGGFEYARGGIETPHGRIESAWEYRGGKVFYFCTVPANTTATLELDGKVQELQSGTYEFSM